MARGYRVEDNDNDGEEEFYLDSDRYGGYTTFEGIRLIHQTGEEDDEGAFLVENLDTGEIWVPKSVSNWICKKKSFIGEYGTLEVQTWWAIEKGLV